MRMFKARYFLVVILLLAVCWLSYWIGYISSKPTAAEQLLLEEALQKGKQDKVLTATRNPDVHAKDEPQHIKHVQGIHMAHIAHIKDHLHSATAAKNATRPKVGVVPLKESNQAVGVEWKHLQKQKEEKDGKEKQIPATPKPPKMAKFDLSDPFYAVIHAGVATKVHGKIHEKLPTLPDTVPKEAYIFEAEKLHPNPRLRPSVGNGHVGTVVHASDVFMNGLYNGLRNTSHRAAIPSPCSMNITGTEPSTKFSRRYRLNVGEGVYSEVSEGPGYTLTQRLYAHRNITPLMVVEVDLVRTKAAHEAMPQKLLIKLNKWTASYDLTFNKHDSGLDEVSYKVGRIDSPETAGLSASEVHVLYDKVPDVLEVLAETPRIKWVFLSAVAHTKEKAFQAYTQGSALVKQHDALYGQHVEAWARVWSRGRVDVVGNVKVARAVYGSWYYILSSMPVTPATAIPTTAAAQATDRAGEEKEEEAKQEAREKEEEAKQEAKEEVAKAKEAKAKEAEAKEAKEEEFVGLSPTGLPYGDKDDDYMGHVFWDQETWMYPPILLLRPDLAHTLLRTRKRTQAAAAQYAKDTGFQGLRYPWESARTGFDVTPDQNCSTYELHINGDISLAIVQYLYATNDTSIIRGEGFDEIIAGIANFWVSKLRQNQRTMLYEIHDVMPPDEDCIKVNNSVYTNEVARIALAAPEYMFSLVHKKETHWKDFADNIYMPFDEKHDYHPEFDGYKYGSTVKQADAIMLGYPLQRDVPEVIRMNDLKAYAKVTDQHGPAMTWPMYCIGWLEVKDVKQAEEYFMKSFDYIHTEFQVWTEVLAGADSGATNFLTGMGGFLQSVMFGYGGFRLRADRLDLDPELPPGSTELHVVGLSYLGNTLDVFVTEPSIMVSVTSRAPHAAVLHLQEYKTQAVHDLDLKKPLTLKRQKCAIFKATENH